MADYPVAGWAVLITGAGSGIGAATARALHERGALDFERVVAVDLLGAWRTVRVELAGRGVTAGVLYPGWVAASVLRGVVNPLSDRLLVRNAEVQRLLAELEAQARQQGRQEGRTPSVS